jgi:DNA-binding response OmpR family regulator
LLDRGAALVVTRGGSLVELTPTELRRLAFLVRDRSQVLPRMDRSGRSLVIERR